MDFLIWACSVEMFKVIVCLDIGGLFVCVHSLWKVLVRVVHIDWSSRHLYV